MDYLDLPCILCGKDTEGDTIVVTKGLKTITEASILRKDGLHESLEGKSSVRVHKSCRQNYTRPSSIKAATASPPCPAVCIPSTSSPVLRSLGDNFDYKTNCFFCGEKAIVDSKIPLYRRKKFRMVATLEIKNSLLQKCEDRRDEWGDQVKARLLNVSDLVAPEARYHKNCHDTFSKTNSSEGSVGRPMTNKESFLMLCSYIEQSDECQYSFQELQDILAGISGKKDTYSDKHLKNLLLEHFKERIIVSNVSGRKNIVCLSDTVHKIIDTWYKERDRNLESEKLRIVLAAADIIKEDIQKMAYDHETYPGTNDITCGGEHLIPNTLSAFTQRVMKKKNISELETVDRKCVVINHAIISAVRPRSFLSPLHIGLALTLHRLYGSKHLINMLSSMGVCASYYEASVYINSLINAGSPIVNEDAFIQHVFDNADVNVRTLDGLNTFHAMGGVQCITPDSSVETQLKVARISSGTFNPECIRIRSYPKKKARNGLSSITVKDYSELKAELGNSDFTVAAMFPLNSIWLSGMNVQPGWNGFMNLINSRREKCDSTYVMALPFINLDATNTSTIFTALCFAAEQSRKQNQSCIVTFDQPLFLKASEIVASAESDSDISKIVVRLGGFHLLMSFMGSVGRIMEDSGLECLWTTVYGKNTVQTMLNGHSYARCVRAYALTASAIVNVMKDHCKELKDSIAILEKFHKQLLNHEMDPECVVKEPEFIEAHAKIDTSIKNIETSSRTSKLWLTLLKCIDLILQFIYAERTGDWDMHLVTTVKMLPFFHAAGHLPYSKSAHLYAQQMMNIKSKLTQRDIELFTKKGMFTVRRSGKFWSGTWTDMCIEQCLMRPMKSVGGLTHGRGITESTLSKWVFGTPHFLKIQEAIEEFLGTAITFTEQHVEIRESRRNRDHNDLEKFTNWLRDHNPFTKLSGELVSLSCGYVSDDSVNCDQAYEIGIAAMRKMEGKSFGDLRLHRRDMVKTQAKPKKVKVRSQEVTVNPQQLFNRILCVCDSPNKLKEYLAYELASRPPALFDDVSLRKGTKSSLMKIFEIGVQRDIDETDTVFVLDGGFLIHYINWPNDLTYGEIVNNYCEYVVSNYGQHTIIIFDGYPEYSTTKNEEQIRRAAKKTSCDINFDKNTKCMTPKENFLGNRRNKKKLLQAVACELDKKGLATYTAEEDADVDIVKVAIEKLNQFSKVVVVGSDTDLLVLLVALTPEKANMFFCKPKGGKDPAKVFYNVKTLIEEQHDIRRALLFAHAVSGCDTTSCFYGLGKVKSVEMLKSSSEAKKHALMFTEHNVSKEQLLISGERFALELYGLNKYSNLNEARYFKFTMMAKKSNLRSNFDLAKMPPTTEACQQHMLRVYLQVQRWLGNNLPPSEWGWKLEVVREAGGDRKILKPITTSKPFAPNDLLYLVSCSCKSACGNYCGCRKTGLHCSAMCEHCNGLSCNNATAIDEDEDAIDDEELCM